MKLTNWYLLKLLAGIVIAAATLGCASTSVTAPTSKNGSSKAVRPPTRSPLDLDDLKKLQQALLFGEEDVKALRKSRELLEPQVEQLLDVWYGFVGATPHLLETFVDRRTGKPDGAYLAAVRKRFGQWVLDTADAQYDQKWLDYQHEIGLRHHTTKKNETDGANASAIVPFRYVPALVYPITATLKPFLQNGDHSSEEVEQMHQAWIKSVLLQSILWSHPYVREGDF